mmetsp:Transcript_24611/g.30947  ORF Transcript_24611/g.30947 Transcript_24611/m.30947 type:complete len:491 (+) Transcript_24611:238-1710(+)
MSTLQNPVIDRTLRGHKDGITSVAFHPVPSDLAPRKQHPNADYVQIASAALDGGLTLWNYQSTENEVRAFRLLGHDTAIHHLSYSPSGNILASCSSDKTVRLWVPKRSGDCTVLKGHKKAVRCVDFSHHRSNEDSLLVTCSDDKTLKLWKVRNKAFQCSMVGHKNWVRSCKFSPDSKFAMSGSDDGSLKLWDCNNGGEEILSYRFPSSIITSHSSSTSFEATVSVRHVDFHPAGNILAASGSDGNVHLYDLRSDKVIHSIGAEANRSTTVTRQMNFCSDISFHPKGHLMTSNSDGTFKLFDVRNWNCSFSITHSTRQFDFSQGGKTSNYCCAFSSEGSKLVTGGDKQVLVWRGDFEGFEGIYCSSTKSGSSSGASKQAEKPDKRTIKSECDVKNNKPKSRTEKNTGNTNTAVSENECRIEDIAGRNNCCQNEEKPNLPPDELNSIPEPLSRIMDHIIGQLDFLTSTMVAIEKRLSIQEKALAALQNVKNK